MLHSGISWCASLCCPLGSGWVAFPRAAASKTVGILWGLWGFALSGYKNMTLTSINMAEPVGFELYPKTKQPKSQLALTGEHKANQRGSVTWGPNRSSTFVGFL